MADNIKVYIKNSSIKVDINQKFAMNLLDCKIDLDKEMCTFNKKAYKFNSIVINASFNKFDIKDNTVTFKYVTRKLNIIVKHKFKDIYTIKQLPFSILAKQGFIKIKYK